MDKLYLVHHGIKGMHWGVKRGPPYPLDGSVKRAEKNAQKRADKQVKKERKKTAKNARNLSDSDIDKMISRIEKEKKLKDLVAQDTRPGRTAVKNIMKSAGKKAAAGAAAGGLAYAAKVAITKEFSPRDFAAYVAPNPNKKK